MFDAMAAWAVEILKMHGMWGLAIFSYTEAIFHPIPVDPVAVGLSLLGMWSISEIFWVSTLSSALGGLTAHFLGRKYGKGIFIKFFGHDRFEQGKKFFEKWGIWAVLVCAITPIPFKVVAWMSGILHMNVVEFFVVQLFGRAVRFAAVLWGFEALKNMIF